MAFGREVDDIPGVQQRVGGDGKHVAWLDLVVFARFLILLKVVWKCSLKLQYHSFDHHTHAHCDNCFHSGPELNTSYQKDSTPVHTFCIRNTPPTGGLELSVSKSHKPSLS